MVLTEEQKLRIRKNRERALRIQKERREKYEKQKEEHLKESERSIEDNQTPSKKRKTTDSTLARPTASTTTSQSISPTTNAKQATEDHDYHSSEPLEDFEEGASQWVTKTEAMNTYCLPEGTMAVCSYEEKQNPRNPSFKPMKLYKRSEIRYRAHKRHGGVEGLVKEREKRRKRKLEKDMEAARDIFK
ncbi:unnamed protein product [Pseudo-nitzschia multistriata]|uniref:XPA C-terminal domain-containing protein n=1 Tax=Pseudo-nitzschia multistriata TaxID=183589 RepID=A0A448ZMD5_9STRA|nr:unnamed protein product [Pseudo-nitzschia multistriata]